MTDFNVMFFLFIGSSAAFANMFVISVYVDYKVDFANLCFLQYQAARYFAGLLYIRPSIETCI